MAGLPRVFDILVLFGIKVVNFLCSGREGFQLYTRVLLGNFLAFEGVLAHNIAGSFLVEINQG